MKAHHKRADGGKVEKYTPDDNVEREAEERARGGRAMKKRAAGGKVEGEKPKRRMDRPCRKDGGRVGADKSPLSSAHKVSPVSEHRTDD